MKFSFFLLFFLPEAPSDPAGFKDDLRGKGEKNVQNRARFI